jgi:hypothetical protein
MAEQLTMGPTALELVGEAQLVHPQEAKQQEAGGAQPQESPVDLLVLVVC